MNRPPHPLVMKDHHHSMAQDWPDDGPVEPSGSGVFRGFVYGVLGTIGAQALLVWGVVVWGGWQR